ncbi:hypothetical protein G7054_g12945 [Neopestalotiopsis clavispora]|nr:hypothetical protein G7054_g12945 [Neopestalotiopsis clavispora]
MSSPTIEDHVHAGLWTDWSRGAILGRTLTMSRTEGNLLIAFTASFIAFVATRFWRVLCLVLHRCCSSDGPEFALHHQRQVILRNSSGPDSGLVSLVRLSWAWRRLGFRRLLHLSSLSILAALTFAAFTVAGGFSSTISSAVGDVVLINSANCGFCGYAVVTSMAGLISRFYSNQLNNAANYAQQCYTTNSSGLLGCGRFVKSNTRKTVNTNASCPFEEGLCRSSHSNILLDTGFYNTNDDLGLNAPVEEQSSIRYVLSCAPLVTDGYTSRQNTSVGEVIQYHYGLTTHNDGDVFNYSFRTDPVESQYAGVRNPDGYDGINYRVQTRSCNTVEGQPENGSYYVPMPGLQRSDGDVTIVHLAGYGVVFEEPGADAWYRPFVRGKDNLHITTARDNEAIPYYIPEEPASPLGCVEQYQFCNSARPDNSSCGPLASFRDAILGATTFFNMTVDEMVNAQGPISPKENRAASLLWWLGTILATNASSIYYLIQHLGAKSLASQSQLFSGAQYALPSNQWQIDVANWFDTLLALQQASYISTVIGPDDQELLDGAWYSFEDTDEGVFCDSQKMRSSTHTSFSVFGLCFTYVTGALIILISAIIEPILTFFFKRRGYQRFRELEWATNQQLQLHRLAHEPLGYGNWTRATKFVPMTEKDEYLGQLDVSTDHPVIAKPSSKTEHETNHQVETSSNDEATITVSSPRDDEENRLEEQMVVADGGSIGNQVPDHADMITSEDATNPDSPLRPDDITRTRDGTSLGDSQTSGEMEERIGGKTAAVGVTSVEGSSSEEAVVSHEDISPLDESSRRVNAKIPGL